MRTWIGVASEGSTTYQRPAVSISTHGIALNITVQSYRDQLDFGFIVGANIIPHVQVMCDMLPDEFAALEAAYAPPAADIKGAAE